MKRLILICAALVLVQAGLVVLTHFSGHSGGLKPSQGVLLPLNTAEINELLLEDGAGQRVVLKKEKDRWLLPEAGSFPADTVRVQELIERLAGMQRGWPEATTAQAASRFKVASDRFERKLSLRKDGNTLGTVYFGTSPGLRKVYLRVDNDPDIQTLALPPHELEVKVDNWIDTAILHLKPEQITRAELPGLHLERTQDGLQPADLNPDEEVVKERRDALVKRLSRLTVTAILGSERKPEYGLDDPALRYTVQLDGGATIDYLFGQPPKAETAEVNDALPSMGETLYVLKVSNQEQLFRVEGWQVEEVKNATRAALVRVKAQKPLAGDLPAPPSPAVPEGEAK